MIYLNERRRSRRLWTVISALCIGLSVAIGIPAFFYFRRGLYLYLSMGGVFCLMLFGLGAALYSTNLRTYVGEYYEPLAIVRLLFHSIPDLHPLHNRNLGQITPSSHFIANSLTQPGTSVHSDSQLFPLNVMQTQSSLLIQASYHRANCGSNIIGGTVSEELDPRPCGDILGTHGPGQDPPTNNFERNGSVRE